LQYERNKLELLMFTHAILREPGANFANGLTTAGLGAPDFELALRQHEDYCQALRQCGLTVTRLPADLHFPDSTFVEDVAILAGKAAILTRPGALSRRGEVAGIQQSLAQNFAMLHSITPPGTVEGGDICEAEGHFFIGISQRTNEDGAQQLAGLLTQAGYTSSFIDIRGIQGLLHLKSGIASLGERRLVLIDELEGMEPFNGYEIVPVEPGENYAANCVRVNNCVLIASGFPQMEATIRSFGYQVMALDMSEFQKMDGGLSCLSLRF
jgi:dimethylargininase